MSDRILVATRKGLFDVSRQGGAWRIRNASFVGDSVPMVLADPRDRAWYAALGHGHFGSKLHRSIDEGKTWNEISAPKYPEKPADYVDVVSPMSGKITPWSLELIWSLEPGGADEPGALWLGTIPGGLFRSDDAGQTWRLIRSLWDEPSRKEWFGGGYDFAGIHSVIVDPRDSRRVTVGVSCGGVWVSRDRGESWKCQSTGMFATYAPPQRRDDPVIQDPHRLSACHAAPEVVWSQHHCGVFRTANGCERWDTIEQPGVSAFGFAVAAHPSDPKTAWFVPALSDEKRVPVDGRVVVTRTRDGGKTFDTLRDGLPQENAYDLVYRHALDIDQSGQRLAFGSTTGSLFVSEDGGDHWRTISAHLPPVYCVRFIA